MTGSSQHYSCSRPQADSQDKRRQNRHWRVRIPHDGIHSFTASYILTFTHQHMHTKHTKLRAAKTMGKGKRKKKGAGNSILACEEKRWRQCSLDCHCFHGALDAVMRDSSWPRQKECIWNRKKTEKIEGKIFPTGKTDRPFCGQKKTGRRST